MWFVSGCFKLWPNLAKGLLAESGQLEYSNEPNLFGGGIYPFIHTFFENSFCQNMHFPEAKRQCSGGKGETAKYNVSIAYSVWDAPDCSPCVAGLLRFDVATPVAGAVH